MSNERNPKTLEQIFNSIKDLSEKEKNYDRVYNKLKEELVEYYSTIDGRAEIDRTPHKSLRTLEAIDLLMQGISSRTIIEVKQAGKNNDNKTA